MIVGENEKDEMVMIMMMIRNGSESSAAKTRISLISYHKKSRKIIANLTQNIICDGLVTV